MIRDVDILFFWEHNDQNLLLDNLRTKYERIAVYEIEWRNELVKSNMIRLFGKEMGEAYFDKYGWGSRPFLFLIVKKISSSKDNLLDLLKLSKKELDNVLFVEKNKKRSTTILLLGNSLDYYLNCASSNYITFRKDLLGANGWDSLAQLFSVLNETVEYVVMRNFESYPNEFDFSIHGDIDLLVDDFDDTFLILNATKKNSIEYRVFCEVNISGELIDFDLRYLGDGYYCKKLEEEILNSRVLFNGFYVPEKKFYYYTLVYHALIHKKKVLPDYKLRLAVLYNEIFSDKIDAYNEDVLKGSLTKFLDDQNYPISEPYDLSVYFNKKFSEEVKYSKRREKHLKKNFIRHQIMKMIVFVKSVLHK